MSLRHRLSITRHRRLFTSRQHLQYTLGRCTMGIRTIEAIATNVGLPFLDVVRVEACADDSRVGWMQHGKAPDGGRGPGLLRFRMGGPVTEGSAVTIS
jgi:hypothetical protein